MPRPQRCRRICSRPAVTRFSPEPAAQAEAVVLTLDEFEAIRLIDLEKQTHEQCAKQMEISRSTATEIYESAREKIAYSLVNGRGLEIGGGHYRLCDGHSGVCYQKRCKKQPNKTKMYMDKGDHLMRIAVTYENGEIFQHFGHTEQFKFNDVENGQIISSHITGTNGSGHGALAGFLTANKADVLICGGIGGGAQAALAEAGIQLYGGVQGSADEAVKAFLNHALSFNPDVHCSHHDHEHGTKTHTCGEHGCGQHSENEQCGEHGCGQHSENGQCDEHGQRSKHGCH